MLSGRSMVWVRFAAWPDLLAVWVFSAARFFCVYVYQLFGVAGGVGLADTSFRVRAGHGWRPRGAGRRRELFCFGYFRREWFELVVLVFFLYCNEDLLSIVAMK